MDDHLAAIDLGSNTFRLSIGRVVQRAGNAQIYSVDRLRESVRMAEGLDDQKILSQDAVDRAIAVLKRFGERLAGFPASSVRAVATNTFRVARNAHDILPVLEAALGFPIEIVSGQEEARLIFSGVANELPPSESRRLVIDIGGGSTEFIIGCGYKPIHMASLYMGCTSYTKRFFPDGRITEARMQQAQLAAGREIETIARLYRRTGWREAYGSSGTAKGLLAVLTENGFSKQGITLSGLKKLRKGLIEAGTVRLEDWKGLKAERAPILGGGLAIMLAAFQGMNIHTMQPGDGALRTGVLYDLLGRDSHHDKRDETVRLFVKRYQIDVAQAERVTRLALELFDQTDTQTDPRHVELRQSLAWAAMLHEAGLSIAHSDYHKHSAYILEHADMPGFSRDDQALLAFLALGHQGKLGKLHHSAVSRIHWLALSCLRLAVLLLRRREAIDSTPIRLEASDNNLDIHVNAQWLAEHPLGEYSLKAELGIWHKNELNVRLLEAAAE
ncbi:MAG: Ppx/GppA family phosphatase [Alcaligenaceae bacterium]|nr:Ppx/GppA family phosphatase [Alcaligenaceae bacterium]